MHTGFREYTEKLKKLILTGSDATAPANSYFKVSGTQKVAGACSSIEGRLGNKRLHLIVGHSLGGASATMFTEMLNEVRHAKRPSYGLVTFGAPRTHFMDDLRNCENSGVAGTRVWHEEDPVTSNAYGYFEELRHAPNSKSLENVC